MDAPEKFRNKYTIATTRLQGWDYGSPGLYFVTICTKSRGLYFGNIVEPQNFAAPMPDGAQKIITPNTETQNLASLQPTIIGNIANQYWLNIPKHFPFVELDEYVIMPDHVHGILFLNNPDHTQWESNKFGPQSKNLASVVRGYKAGVKTFATANKIEFAWQPRFYDRIIRSEKELNNIRKYIVGNPEKWRWDKNNPESLTR